MKTEIVNETEKKFEPFVVKITLETYEDAINFVDTLMEGSSGDNLFDDLIYDFGKQIKRKL